MVTERLAGALQDDIRLGLLSPTVARELARLLRGDQVPMAATIRAHELTSKQAHRIVTELLRTADHSWRQCCCRGPSIQHEPSLCRAAGGSDDLRLDEDQLAVMNEGARESRHR